MAVETPIRTEAAPEHGDFAALLDAPEYDLTPEEEQELLSEPVCKPSGYMDQGHRHD